MKLIILRKTCSGRDGSQRGVALLIVLWVMVILMASSLSFALLARTEALSTWAQRLRTQTSYLAKAGVERGVAEIFRRYSAANTGQQGEDDVWRIDGTPYEIKMGDGGARIQIYDEAGKISLAALTDSTAVVLRNLLVNMKMSPADADGIVDSILDWKDADDLHRLHGAESEYYLSQPNPYQPRNADFETLEELLLVKGMTREILYGSEKRKGLINFLTIRNDSELININTAPREVLEAIPGLDEGAVNQIMEFRKTLEIKDEETAKGLIGAGYEQAASYLTTNASVSTVLTIESTGFKDNNVQVIFPVRATVAIVGAGEYRYVSFCSPAEMQP
ncbi:MAG: type II secretion system protein GspK [Smithellaceae bacterium]|nr:type II secretion system protein GspK [Smithellaceae bacterium]